MKWWRWLFRDEDVVNLAKVSWRTREPRPVIWSDGHPSVATMLKELK